MPPPATLDELVGLIRKAGAADDAAVEQFAAGRPAGELGSAEAAAGAMVRDGLLTKYQAQRLLRGSPSGLRIADRYRVLDRLGGGGMGRVFLCEDTRDRRAVAVKVLPSSLGQDADAVARFEREARAAALLDHPGIVRALDVGHDGSHQFLVLEFVDGADLHRYVSSHGPLAPPTAAHYVARTAEALQRAADLEWVHRDVKPHNLMVDRAGGMHVLDLGLARPSTPDSVNMVTEQGASALLGTADFVAPEQAVDSSQVDGRADVYSLGATFYFVLTGRPPFPDGSLADKLLWHRTKDPEPVRQLRPEVPEGMALVLERMMAKDPADRYQTPAAVAAALAEWATTIPPPPDTAGLPDWSAAVRRLLGLPLTEPAITPSPPPSSMPSSFPRRPAPPPEPDHRGLSPWIAVAALVAGLATATFFATRGSSGPAASAAPPSAGVSPTEPTNPETPTGGDPVAGSDDGGH
jgi:eukaryotic-like serine/threonine-protein kinase